MSENSKKQPDFEVSMKKLEDIAQRIQGGNQSLEQTFSDFETGMKLAGQLQEILENYEQKIEILREGRREEFSIENQES